MLFAGTDLAARIERAECGLLTDCARAIERRRPAAGVLAVEIAGGVATYTGPVSPLNKLAGLGFGGPVDADALGRVEQLFAERGTPVQAEVSCLADPSVGETLTRRGYTLVGFENVLGLALSGDVAAAEGGAGIEVAESGAGDFATWLDVVAEGFAHPDSQGLPAHEEYPRDVLERVVGDMAGAPGFVRYLARRGGEPAGGASMRLGDGVAQLCGAATVPAHRRRGVQGALLARRLEAATRAGCDVAVVTTQPGSRSHENVQRKGFELLYTRAVLVRGT